MEANNKIMAIKSLIELSKIAICPSCKSEIEYRDSSFICKVCGHRIKIHKQCISRFMTNETLYPQKIKLMWSSYDD